MTDRFTSGAALRTVVRATVPVFVVMIALEFYLDTRPFGEYFRNLEYSILQSALRSESTTQSVRHKDRFIFPVIVDISRIPFDPSLPTDRHMLDELIDALESLDVAAIGVDIDFSPDDSGRFITAQDPQLFERWSKHSNLRIGVFRREGDTPDHWLGHRAFRGLAAGIMLPESDPGYAYQFSHLESTPGGRITNPDDFLLEMPAALYEITHQGERSTLVEDGRLKRPETDKRIHVGSYPIDYSSRAFIDVISYRKKGDLEQWADRVAGRTVLVGDLRDAGDSRSIPGLAEPVSGVMIHAAALATLNKGLLRYIDAPTSIGLDLALLVVIAFMLAAAHYLKATVPELGRMDDHVVEILLSMGAAIVVFGLSISFVGLTHIFWPDFLWIATGFVLHPFANQLIGITSRGTKGFLKGATRV